MAMISPSTDAFSESVIKWGGFFKEINYFYTSDLYIVNNLSILFKKI